MVEDAQRRMPEAALELEQRRARLVRKVSSRNGDDFRRNTDRGQRDVRQVQLEAPILDGTA